MFEFRVFLHLDKLPHQGLRTHSSLLFTHSWRENYWIHTFPKGISAILNAITTSRIWTRVTVSISYAYNHYTTGTSFMRYYTAPQFWLSIYIYIYIYIVSSWKFEIKAETSLSIFDLICESLNEKFTL